MPRLFFLLSLVYACFASADTFLMREVPPSEALQVDGARGYWFYKEPYKEPEAEAAPAPSQAQSTPQQPVPKECSSAATWTAHCGFVDPKGNFEFQVKQRDALMQQMAMQPDSSKAVEDYQRYNKWMVQQAIKAAQMWQYNLAQRPDLDPGVQAPISQFGLGLVTKANEAAAKDIWTAISDSGGFLTIFTRDDCTYCHAMLPLLGLVSRDTSIPAYVAPLDGVCPKEVPQDICLPQKVAYDSAAVLQVSMVPSVFLYVPDQTWIRVANGVVTSEAIKARISNFFTAYRTGLAKGLSSEDGKPAMSFSGDAGRAPTAAGAAAGVPLPTPREMQAIVRP